jgi:hypothetical protein
MKPPKTRGIRVTREPPFISLVETRMSKAEHSSMAILAIIVAVWIQFVSVPNAAAIAPAFVSGYALHAWLVHDDYYNLEETDESNGDEEVAA